jgi:hypothetical protein
MSRVRNLHNQALTCANQAKEALSRGDAATAERLFLDASTYETEAASLISITPENEPTRSILYLGAASFAWSGKDLSEAERLCACGLAGFPQNSTQNDLYKLIDEIKYELIWRKQANAIEDAELSMRLYGDGIRFGSAPLKSVLKRVESLAALCSRTVQRIVGKPYDDIRKKDSNARPFMTEMAVDTPGSFGVKLKFSRLVGEQISFLQPEPNIVLNDIIKNIDLMTSGDFATLQKNIPDESYLVNFIAAAKEIAPDGTTIRTVGLATKNKKISFNVGKVELKQYTEEAIPSLVATKKDYPDILRGYLDIADRKRGTLTLTDEEGKEYRTKVKSGLEEVARKYFGSFVEVEYSKKGSSIVLTDIQSLEEIEG